MAYENLITAEHGSGALRAGVITLHRPRQLNALNDALMDELSAALEAYDADERIGCIVITGSERAFAAGADIPTLARMDFMQAYKTGLISRNWEALRSTRKPVIAAVAGLALGGGCELAMMCDFIIAADNARFGQPELKLGVIPGAGGTQRLPRAVGKSKAMDLVLTARTMDAVEAERAGLVSRVVAPEKLMDEALGAAAAICALSLPSILMAKECVNHAYEMPLAEGIQYERRLFHALFATQDQKEGMAAFLEKRAPVFGHR
jgi:enoyl-CoA hydratase